MGSHGGSREQRECDHDQRGTARALASLDLDPNERAEDLSQYARREGFGWRFVVASRELSRSLAATFGDQVLSPPATPLIILGPDGALIEKHVGIKSAGDLAALIEEHLP